MTLQGSVGSVIRELIVLAARLNFKGHHALGVNRLLMRTGRYKASPDAGANIPLTAA